MKTKLLLLTAFAVFLFPGIYFGQAPTLGTTANFVLFTSVGAVSNTGISQITGNVGTNSGSSTAFGNVNGVMHDNDAASALCATDLLVAYNQLNSTVPAFFPAPLLGNGQILNAGVYKIAGPAVLNLGLTLDGQGNPNAVFIIQIQGSFSTNALAKVYLINGALACNVFWKVEGLVSMGAGTSMKGTIIANNSAINMGTGDTLEGRALSTNGAITIDGDMAYTPIGCGSPYLTGPLAPVLASVACYGIFSGNGPVTNTGVTHVVGDIGTNVGLTTGFNPLFVTGMIHPVPDGSTATCATDLGTVYNYLNTLPYDIELLYPVQFGNGLVLTPHIYRMNAACTFTDTVFLNAEGNANAVFVIQINGALTTSTYANVKLVNGTQAKNVFWKVEGAVSINNYSIINGTIVSNNGAINMTIGDTLNGRALSTNGAINTSAIFVVIPPGCGPPLPPTIITQPANQIACAGNSVSFSVTATGTGLSYQWRKGIVNLVNSGNISGVNTATLTINPVTLADAAANYNVIVTGTFPPTATSGNASLVVNVPPAISSQPLNQTVCTGTSASFSVSATGGGLTYQWRIGAVNLTNTGNISGAMSSILVINPANAPDAVPNYNVVVSGTCPLPATSVNASLIVNSSPVASAASNSPVCLSNPIDLTALTVAGATYSWTGPNAFSSTLQNPIILSAALVDAGSYTLVVTNTGCSSSPDTVNVVVNPCSADLSIIKTVSNMYPIIGHNIVFTITATNNGPSAATGVAVTDILQSGYVFVSSTMTTGTFDPNTGVWLVGYMNNTATAQLVITVTVIANGNYVNTAIIYGNQMDVNSLNNASSVETFPTDFNIPEGFSPNGDGINDGFVIRGIDNYPNNSFLIFNRWGDKVFGASPYKNTWDGKSNQGMSLGGNDLPVGTYFYLLDLGDGSAVIKGTIYLNK